MSASISASPILFTDPPAACARTQMEFIGTQPLAISRIRAETRALQACLALAACVPVAAGLAGVVFGPAAVDLPGLAAAGDSHARYLSGLLLAIGIGLWSAVPAIERRGARLRLLCGLVVLGGIGRLVSLAVAGAPSAPMLAALGLELGVAPLLVFWQARLAARRSAA